ncbi:MAG: PH domain-containing protein [Planctomycetaceae bacterium]|nr:PH domain-containing protein [Planctomycetaceae bacterium]
MGKEIDFDREKVTKYLTLEILSICAVLAFVYGIGIILGIIYYFGIAWWLSPMQANACKYQLYEKTLHVDRGVIVLRRSVIPLDQITDLVLVQNFIMRFVGIWTLQIQTAGKGTSFPVATLLGIINPEQVRDEILAARDACLKSYKS